MMTSLGAALSVLVLVSVLALVNGLQSSFQVSANPNHLLAMRSGSTSELVSLLSRQNYQDILSHAGIARSSLEMITVVGVSTPGGAEMNVNLRGMTETGWTMRPQLKVTVGRKFLSGAREVVVGSAIAKQCPAAQVGGTLHFGEAAWTVVGIADGGQSAFSSEIFGDLNQVSGEYRRFDTLSSVLLEARPGRLEALAASLRADRRLSLLVETEKNYYSQQMSAAAPVQFMGTFAAILLAIAGAVAAMNTMYQAVARRAPEIGVLRVLGFSRSSVMASFLLESVLISLIGGAIGCLLALPLNRMETAIGSFNTWSEMSFRFRVTPPILLCGLGFAVAIGVVGGYLPARNAARMG